jgi:hypothetical protein
MLMECASARGPLRLELRQSLIGPGADIEILRLLPVKEADLDIPKRAFHWSWGRRKENGGALADSAISCSSMKPCGQGTARQLHRSVRPLGSSVARVTQACAHRLRPSGRREPSTSDEPRQPVRPELRPNQRLNVPLGSPPFSCRGLIADAHRPPKRAPIPEF